MEQPERWRAFDVLGHLNAVTAVNHLAEALALSVTARVVQPLRFAHPNGVATLPRMAWQSLSAARALRAACL